VALHPPSLAGVFIYSSHGKCPFPLSSGAFLTQPLLQAFRLQGCWVGAATPAFSGRLGYLQFCEGLPLPHSSVLRAPHLRGLLRGDSEVLHRSTVLCLCPSFEERSLLMFPVLDSGDVDPRFQSSHLDSCWGGKKHRVCPPHRGSEVSLDM
jgi:hypothetical protein